MADCKKMVKLLPDAYQELEYIQSGSLHAQTGYIDTGLVGTDLYGCEIETCMKVTISTTANLYYLDGSYISGQATQSGLVREDDRYVHSIINMAFNTAVYSGSIALSDWHTIYASDGLQKTDDVIVGNRTYGTFNNLHYLLFARSDTGVTLSPPFAMKYFWVKKNGQYIRNMIPAKRKSDNVVGMYDIANDVFYTSENQYAFIGGDAVEPAWQHSLRKLTTATDTLTTLPADIYADGNNATVGLKGNMSQTGTPTPSSPIQPSECGDLETSGAKAGQYKIPISSASTTTPVYLGEVQTTRKIKELVLDGTGDWFLSTAQAGRFGLSLSDYLKSNGTITSFCSHYMAIAQKSGGAVPNNSQYFYSGSDAARYLFIVDTNCSTAADFKSYLAAQYANGTPVTVWYVLSSATTGVVNEPLRKIGDYADSLSTSIPTVDGANTLSIGTALQPSEVTANYHGWHTGAVHERESGSWD